MRKILEILTFVVLLCSLQFSFTLCKDEVKYAAVIYRHGDRTPVDPYPTDPWRNESFWPVKFGELTNIGKRQHYALGQWFRKRYSHLISTKFDPSEIYVRSTDVDRTLMSAEVNLAGMFPPINSTVWNDGLMWQPIPVHTVPEKDDEVLSMNKPCIAYNNERHKFKHSTAYLKRLSKYKDLMDYVSAYTGKKIKDYLDLHLVADTLYIETLYNFTLPNWTKSYYPDKMTEPSCYSFRLETITPLMARLKAGPLLKEIVSNMNKAIKKGNKLKLSIYSAHDDTVANILNAMKLFDGNCPVYTATILMELILDNSTADYKVRISYRNSTEIEEPNVLYIPYCGKTCPLERFEKLYSNLLTVDWENECGKQFSPYLGIAFCLGFAIFIAIYVTQKMYFAVMSRRSGATRCGYSNVNTDSKTSKPEHIIVF